MVFGGLNYAAIVLAAVASFVLGAVWYGVLGQRWMDALGKNRDELMGPGGKPPVAPMIKSLLAELVMAWVLAGLIGHLGPGQVTARNGLISAAFVWLGFVATTLVVSHGYQRSRGALTLIDGGHWLAVLLLQGVIIGAMGVR